MGLISDLLLFPVMGPVRGFQFILEQVKAEADAQLLDEGRVQAELMNLSLRYDAGEVSEEEYLEGEAYLLDRLDEVRAYNEGTYEDGAEVAEDAYGDAE